MREGSPSATRRSQSSLAVRADTGPWHLVNASPDVREQLDRLPRDGGGGSVRDSPVASVLLTDAEFDHTLGLLVMREAQAPLALHGSPVVRAALRDGFPVLSLLERWCGVAWTDLNPGHEHELAGGLRVTAWVAGGDAPRYLAQARQDEAVLGLTFSDGAGTLTYAPGLSRLDDAILTRMESSDCVLVDGTCWHDDDLARAGAGTRRAREMGHIPLADQDGSLAVLSRLDRPRVVLVHLNNTNPLLLEDGPERAEVQCLGIEVAYDGMEIALG